MSNRERRLVVYAAPLSPEAMKAELTRPLALKANQPEDVYKALQSGDLLSAMERQGAGIFTYNELMAAWHRSREKLMTAWYRETVKALRDYSLLCAFHHEDPPRYHSNNIHCVHWGGALSSVQRYVGGDDTFHLFRGGRVVLPEGMQEPPGERVEYYFKELYPSLIPADTLCLSTMVPEFTCPELTAWQELPLMLEAPKAEPFDYTQLGPLGPFLYTWLRARGYDPLKIPDPARLFRFAQVELQALHVLLSGEHYSSDRYELEAAVVARLYEYLLGPGATEYTSALEIYLDTSNTEYVD
ncbi:Hypothetical protein POVN_LOCUS249 [uncultured virus]|nr:Hypothetical protein POVN_LOCUS249 [uncultured virus]